ncbi:MAG: hypothetical protein KGM99_10230 [Burkholderiales bacterium]|nr:hypothetical protein [Burkholderiales bacterium]
MPDRTDVSPPQRCDGATLVEVTALVTSPCLAKFLSIPTDGRREWRLARVAGFRVAENCELMLKLAPTLLSM